MGRSYSAAAAQARREGVIDRHHLQEYEVRQDLREFLELDNPNTSGARTLLDETVERAMDQRVHLQDGRIAGPRRNVAAWEDRWGNIMARNRETGTQGKLIDADDRDN